MNNWEKLSQARIAVAGLIELRDEINSRAWRLNDIEQQTEMATSLEEIQAVAAMLTNFKRRSDEIKVEMKRLKDLIG